MKGGDNMETLQTFLDFMIILFVFIMSGCGAVGGMLLVHLIFKEWRKK